MLKAGYLEEWTYHKTYSGVPQGGVISPVLSNIILNKLDTFVEEELIPQYTQGKHRRANLEYNQLSRKMKQACGEKDLVAYRQLEQQRRCILRGQPNDENFRRLRYCRYADDFALGFIGPKSEAVAIKARIQAFLQSIKLALSEEKTLITHAVEGRARFLGYDIYVARNNQRITQHQAAHKIKSRAVNGKIMLSVPPEVANQWQARYTHKGKPIHRAALLNQSDYEIVTKFNVECQGLLNYYILAQNVHKRLSVVRYICWQSLAKTLAAKHKKKSTWVYRRFTGKLENGRKVIRVIVPREKPKKPLVATFGAKPIRYVKTAVINDEIPRPFYKKTELVQRLLADQCELCHSIEDIEVHHVHKLADIKRTSSEGTKDANSLRNGLSL